MLLILASSKLPFWSPEKKKGDGVWGDTWKIFLILLITHQALF